MCSLVFVVGRSVRTGDDRALHASRDELRQRLTTKVQRLSLVIKPELYRNLIAGVIGGQRPESINALDGPYRGDVQRRYTTGLFDLHISGGAVAADIKSHIRAIRRRNAWVHFVLQPVFGNLLLDHFDVPGIAAAKVAAASGETKSALRPTGAEHAVGPTYRTSFTIGNLVRFLGLRL